MQWQGRYESGLECNLSKFECGNCSPQETSKGPSCPSSCQEDQGHNDSLLGSDTCNAVIEVDEEGNEQEAKDACNHQGSGDVEPCGIKGWIEWRLAGDNLGCCNVDETDGCQGDSTCSNQ